MHFSIRQEIDKAINGSQIVRHFYIYQNNIIESKRVVSQSVLV